MAAAIFYGAVMLRALKESMGVDASVDAALEPQCYRNVEGACAGGLSDKGLS